MDFDFIIIGAGVVGLAIGAKLSFKKYNVLVIEQENTFGMHQSSRNSEVIHSGIYYPNNSLKHLLCLEGRHLLYDYCSQKRINYNKIGKYIIAIEQNQENELFDLYQNGIKNQIENLKFDTINNLKKNNPYIKAHSCLYSQETGIIDTHQLMLALIQDIENNNNNIVYNHKLINIEPKNNSYQLEIQADKDIFEITTKFIINCAGLNSDRVAQMAGLDINKLNLNLHYCKGHYFSLNSSKKNIATNLIYPVPPKNYTGLGIHLTIDLAGEIKFGPDFQYLENNIINYKINQNLLYKFYYTIKKYIDNIRIEDLAPNQAGIRAKLQNRNDRTKDFYIQEESQNNLPNLINLIGIESPGMTASLAIAKYIIEQYSL